MRIVLAVDGSACSEAAVNEVARRPWPADSQVRIISAFEVPTSLTSDLWPPMTEHGEEVEVVARRKSEQTVASAAAKLRGSAKGKNLDITTEVVAGSPKRVIVENAEEWGADLIVVGSHRYRSLERLLLGSVSQSVALHAECSVEIVRQR